MESSQVYASVFGPFAPTFLAAPEHDHNSNRLKRRIHGHTGSRKRIDVGNHSTGTGEHVDQTESVTITVGTDPKSFLSYEVSRSDLVARSEYFRVSQNEPQLP